MSAGQIILDMSSEGGQERFDFNSNHDALASRDGSRLVPIRICGRVGHVDYSQAHSIMSLQASLRTELGMHEELFDFADSLNAKIKTDMALREALEQGRLPLQASVADEAVHRIEGRREELAQMQWKVVRDKMQGCEIHINQLSNQIQDMKNQMEAQHKEHQDIVKALRGEMAKSFDQERTVTETGMAQMSERAAAISHLVSAEQNKREFAHQSLEHQLVDLRSAIDEERRGRTFELENHLSLLEEGKGAVALLEQAVEKSEKNHAKTCQELQAEMAAHARSSQASIKEQMAAFTCSAEEMALKMRQSTSQLNTRLGELDLKVTSNTKACADARTRLDAVERRITDGLSSQADAQQGLSERQEQLLQNLESIRIDKQSLQFQVESGGKNLKELEMALARCQEDLTKRIDDQVKELQQDLQNSQRKVITEMVNTFHDLEQKISQRLQKESSSRENATKQIYEEISRASISLKEGTESTEATSQPTPRGSTSTSSVLRSVVYSPASVATSIRSTWSPRDQSNVSLAGAVRQRSTTPSVPVASVNVIPPGSCQVKTGPGTPPPSLRMMPPRNQNGRSTIGTPQPFAGGRSANIPIMAPAPAPGQN